MSVNQSCRRALKTDISFIQVFVYAGGLSVKICLIYRNSAGGELEEGSGDTPNSRLSTLPMMQVPDTRSRSSKLHMSGQTFGTVSSQRPLSISTLSRTGPTAIIDGSGLVAERRQHHPPPQRSRLSSQALEYHHITRPKLVVQTSLPTTFTPR